MVAVHFITISCEPNTGYRHIESHFFFFFATFEILRTFLHVFYERFYGICMFRITCMGIRGVTLRAQPPLVFFFTKEEKRRLCLNRVNSLKPPQPELLD